MYNIINMRKLWTSRLCTTLYCHYWAIIIIIIIIIIIVIKRSTKPYHKKSRYYQIQSVYEVHFNFCMNATTDHTTKCARF